MRIKKRECLYCVNAVNDYEAGYVCGLELWDYFPKARNNNNCKCKRYKFDKTFYKNSKLKRSK